MAAVCSYHGLGMERDVELAFKAYERAGKHKSPADPHLRMRARAQARVQTHTQRARAGEQHLRR